MPAIAYLLVFFVVLAIGGIFWIFQMNQNRYGRVDLPGIFETNYESTEDTLINEQVRRLESYADRGRWLLFFASFLLIIQLFVVIVFLMEEGQRGLDIQWNNYAGIVGGTFYFLFAIFTILIAVRLYGANRDFEFGLTSWEQKYSGLPADQKKNFVAFLLHRNRDLEQSYFIGIALISATFTLFVIWLARWLVALA